MADAGLAAALLLIVGMMVVPLPKAVLDVLISGNLALSLLMLLSAIHGRQALSLSAMPAALLVATLYRLALNVSSTRLILLQADAGEVISAFGHFVVQGDYIVGAVVFVILTIIQFVVIARGAERVAEVGARFSLDAMPGKQLAIDADLRSGAIGAEQGRQLRQALARESQFYGAMDGAMKFVKGDAIASILIVGIDLVAGLVVGVVKRDLSVLESLRVYGLLTIGDGLVSQLPALLIATAAGIVITRVAGEDGQSSLAEELKRQLLGSAQTLRLAALFLAALALVPGLPAVPLMVVAAVCVGLSMLPTAEETAPPTVVAQKRPAPVTVALSPDSQALRDAAERRFATIPDAVYERLGLIVPAPAVVFAAGLPERHYRVLVDELPGAPLALPAGDVAAQLSALEGGLLAALERRADRLINLQQTQTLLDTLERMEPARVRHVVPDLVTVHDLTDLLRRLLAEGVSVRPLGEILELCAALRSQRPSAPPHVIYAQLRQHLGPRICHGLAGDEVLTLLTLDPLVEDTLNEHLVDGDVEPSLALPPDLAAELRLAVHEAARAQQGPRALLTRSSLRPLVHSLLRGEESRVAVLSYQELSPDTPSQRGPVIQP